ncbi:MAG TPA: alginate export family protein [Verrucomicrobiota bacterium]|nr:alginate export family protein [Verrucomicrobiota bacterium]
MLCSLAAGIVAGQAQSASVGLPVPPKAPPAGAPPPQLSPTEQWIKNAKAPASWFSWGADLRIRDEYYDNIVSLTDNARWSAQNVIRFRGRVWASATPAEGVSLNARVAAEPREWTRPAFTGNYRHPNGPGGADDTGGQGMEWRYGIIDSLNLKWTNAFGAPLSLTLGRQDMMFGDYWNWWLVADGTPGDGSWTYFLDSARATLDAKEIKTKFDLVYLYQNARPDAWLPTLDDPGPSIDNAAGYGLTEQNEQGVILYASNKSLNNTTIDGYFIYKGDDKEFANGDDADIYTFGAKIAGALAEHWSYSLEGAYQLGNKKDPTVKTPVDVSGKRRDINAYGGNARLSYLFKDPLNNQAHLVYEYLSGDDPDTQGDDEMFDVLWGRWPRFSELYIYSYAAETSGKVAQANNIQRIGAGWTMSPAKDLHLGAYYNAWFAPQETPTRALDSTLFSKNGDFRGHFLQSVLTYTISRHVKAHLWAEFVWPGDYYASRDFMMFLRPEIYLTF